MRTRRLRSHRSGGRFQLFLLVAQAATWLATAQTPQPDAFTPNVTGQIQALAVQPDGRILIGGSFTVPGETPRTNLARLHADGALDASFDPRADGTIHTVVVLGDGRILVGGRFWEMAGHLRDNLARLHPDGTLDPSFVGRTDGEVRALGLQADGKIIVAGQFNTLDNEWCYSIGRLHADGTKDFGFSFDNAGGANVETVAVQADGKVLMGGGFGHFIRGNTRYRIARWNADGTLDLGFNPGDFSHNDASVNALAVQPDGRILAGGTFTNMAGRACYRIARMSPGGSFDSSFGSGADGQVDAFALQADGKIVVAGRFTMMNGQPRSRLARFNADGSLDAGFNPGANGPVSALAQQTEGSLLIAGTITELAGHPRTNLARLQATSPANRSLSRGTSDITWLRGGTSPEVWRTVFDTSTDGVTWTRLGGGTPIEGGWQITDISLPSADTVRAQGFVASGVGNGSGSVVEDYHGPPLVLVQPLSRTNNAGTTAAFTARAAGSEPIGYQWRKNGTPLAESDTLAGTRTPTLTINDVQKTHEGAYSLVLSNAFGTVTSVVASLTVLDPGIANQPVSQILELGQDATFSVTPVGKTPFTFQWRKDGVALPGATGSVLSLTNLQASDAGRYTVVVSNPLGTIISPEAWLTVNAATLDAAFDAGIGNNAAYAVAVQPDGRILAGGSFYALGGQSRAHIARLDANGSADLSFNPSADGMVLTLALQPDRKIIVGGGFHALGGAERFFLGRLHPDGTPDAGFTNVPNGSVFTMAVQADGAILIGGFFTTFGAQPRANLARLDANGTIDNAFNPDADAIVSSFVVQPDGKIVVGGFFTTLGGQPRTNIARLNPDGTLDPTFAPGATSEDWTSHISALALQSDGKILVGGVFSTLGGQPRANIARLNPDGTLDADFNPGVNCDTAWITPSIASLAVQTDGKILVAGRFTEAAGQPRSQLARLNSDGSLDLTFNPGLGGALPYVNGITLQSDGNILVAGEFTSLAGQPRTNLARLNNTGPATQSLSRNGSTITWLRGGTSPEVGRTTFEHTRDGIAWTHLGTGTRIPGGWALSDVTPPAGGTVRARGFLAAGFQSGSSGFVETLIGAPVFTTQPASQTANAGSSVTFSLLADGPGPLAFQWFKDGAPLADGPGISGSTSSALTLTGVLKSAEGDYRLVVTNSNGSVTSEVATLTVMDPVITNWPLSRYAEPGQNVTFQVTAAGTALNYQWWKDGVVLPQATAASLLLTNVQLGDAGGYRVVVSNPYASLTSGVATLTVNLATLDTNFNPSANLTVAALAPQPDGKILVGGAFSTLAGQTRGRLGRLHANGTLDSGFNPMPNATVYSLALQPDGKILVGGDFTSLAGSTRTAIGRLNTNGALDTSFNTTIFTPPPGDRITARVQSILLLPDGTLVIGGRSSLNGGPTGGFISRLNPNGSTDTNFIRTGGVGGPVTSLALQPDGKILAGGLFTTLRGVPCSRLGRLNPNGTPDIPFHPGADGTVLTLAVQADGRVLVGGSFHNIANAPRTNLARLNPDGTPDDSFAPAVTGNSSAAVSSLALQADGTIVIGGLFTAVAGTPRAHFAALHADGTLDTSANPGPNNYVYGLALQTDGRIVVAGDFTQLGNQPRTRIGRLNLPAPATQNLSYNGTTLTWHRGGSSPEIGRATFEFSTNLTTWNFLGTGTRLAGHWELSGLALPTSGRIRARGFPTGGGFNSSSWLVETTRDIDPNAPPKILTDNEAFGFGDTGFGFNVTGWVGQTVVVEASTNLFQWLPLSTNTLTTDYIPFMDPEALNQPARFYRARLR